VKALNPKKPEDLSIMMNIPTNKQQLTLFGLAIHIMRCGDTSTRKPPGKRSKMEDSAKNAILDVAYFP
jgi:hypothetical protein